MSDQRPGSSVPRNETERFVELVSTLNTDVLFIGKLRDEPESTPDIEKIAQRLQSIYGNLNLAKVALSSKNPRFLEDGNNASSWYEQFSKAIDARAGDTNLPTYIKAPQTIEHLYALLQYTIDELVKTIAQMNNLAQSAVDAQRRENTQPSSSTKQQKTSVVVPQGKPPTPVPTTQLSSPETPKRETTPQSQQASMGSETKRRVEEALKLSTDAKRIKRLLGNITNSISSKEAARKIQNDYAGNLERYLQGEYNLGIRALHNNRHIQSEILTLETLFSTLYDPKTGPNTAGVGSSSGKIQAQVNMGDLLSNPVLTRNIDSVAYAYSLLELNKTNGAEILAEAKWRIPEVAAAIQNNPSLAKEFDLYFSKKLFAYRLETRSSFPDQNKQLLFADDRKADSPDFASLSTSQQQELTELAKTNRTEFLAAITKLKNQGVDVSLVLNSTPAQLNEKIAVVTEKLTAAQAIPTPRTPEQEAAIDDLSQEYAQLVLASNSLHSLIEPEFGVLAPDETAGDAIGMSAMETPPDYEEFLQEQLYSEDTKIPSFSDTITESPDQNQTPASSSPSNFFSRFQKPKPPLLEQANKRKKDLEKLTKTADLIAKLAANPFAPIAAGAGTVAGVGLYGLLTQGVAGGIGATITSLGGAVGGGLLGFAVGGPIGAVVGAIGGGLISGGTALAWQPYGGASLAQMVGQTAAAPFGVDLGVQAFPQTLPSIGINQGALTGAVQQGISNASITGSGLGKTGAKIIGDAAAKALSGSAKFIGGLQSIPSALTATGPVTALVAAPIGTGAVLTIVAVTALSGSFLLPDQAFEQGNEHVMLTKTATPNYSDDPTTVTYTITIKPKEPYQVTVTGVADAMTFQSAGDPPPSIQVDQAILNQLVGEIPPEGRTISYQIPFSAAYDDTRITNTLTVQYNALSTEEGATPQTSSFTVAATISFGNPPAIGGCWPVSGTITQLPFGPFSHAALHADAYDIAAPAGTPIKAPYAGTITRFPYSIAGGSSAGSNWDDVGNMVVLHASIGYDFLFQHLLDFAAPDGQVEAGTIIGYVDSTGNSTNHHLHYQIKRTWNLRENPTSSLLETMVPPDVNGRSPVVVNSQVSAETCAAGSGISTQPTVLDSVGCYEFENGTKNWSPQEISLVKNVLSAEILSDPLRKDAVCKVGGVEQTITLKRVGGDPANYQDAGGSWAAYVPDGNTIEFNDNLFSGDFATGTFGRSTILHEQGHIIHFRHQNVVETGYPVSTHSSLANIISTYPYDIAAGNPNATADQLAHKYYLESFGEAFGACSAYRTQPGAPYRGKQLNISEIQSYCTEIDNTLHLVSP